MKPRHLMTKELQKHVCSFRLAKILHPLIGFRQSLFYWIHDVESDEQPCVIISPAYVDGIEEQYSAYTSGELGSLIGNLINEWAQGWIDSSSQWIFSWGNRGAGSMIEGIGQHAFSDLWNEANARAELLIHLLAPAEYPLVKAHLGGWFLHSCESDEDNQDDYS